MVSKDSITHSKAIQRRTGATFHLATRVLPRRVRRATYVLYAFFRVADDVVDDPDPSPPEEQRRELERIRRVALGESAPDCGRDEGGSPEAAADEVLTAFAELREAYEIPDREVESFVDAMEMDVAGTDFETFADLETYLRGSSVAVANMMLSVMEVDDVERSRPHARALAEAFQLTNFLRDVREDVVDYDRVYLPESTLAGHGLTTADVRALEYSPQFAGALRDELRRTEHRYRTGVAGIATLPEDCQFGVLLSAVLYAEHHRLIRARECDVVSARPSLSLRRRLSLLVRTWPAWRRTGDPEAVFYRVSPVERVPPADADDEWTDARATAAESDGDDERARATNPDAGTGHSVAARPRNALAAVVPWGRD